MNEFAQILELDREIAELDKQIAVLKRLQDIKKIARDKLAIDAAPTLSEVPHLDIDGVRWGVRKGKPSIQLKPEITVLSLPEMFVRRSPDKNAMLKAYKQSPELIESFADIQLSPDKLTYKII